MSVEFLTPEQRQGYGRYPGELTPEQQQVPSTTIFGLSPEGANHVVGLRHQN